MKIGDLVKVKGDSRIGCGLGIVLNVKKDAKFPLNSRILEVFFDNGKTYTITEPLLEAIT